MSEDLKEKVSDGLSWLSLAAKALSFLQAVLPAFFVAWNNSLMNKNQELTGRLEHAKLKLKAKEKEYDLSKDIDPRANIDAFLDK